MIKHLRTKLTVVILVALSFSNVSNSFGNSVGKVSREVYYPYSWVVNGVYQKTHDYTVINEIYQGSKTTVPQQVYVPIPKPIKPKPTPPPKPTVPVQVTQLVKPSIVWATTVRQGNIYAGAFSKRVITSFPKGAVVQVLSDRELTDYNIVYNGKSGWVKANMLIIPSDPVTNAKRLSKQQLEDFVNIKAFASNTKQMIWVDIDRQVANVFTGKKGEWKLIKSIPVATGRNATPTVRGTFKIQSKGSGFTVNEKIKVVKDTQFNGAYKFHSVLLDNKGKVVDGTLSKRRSHGCIRMAVSDATWLQENVTLGSLVWIY